MIKIYTKSSCAPCQQAKQLLNSKGILFIEVSLDDPTNREMFVQQYPDIKSAPAIFEEGLYVGGYTDLVERLNEGNGMLLVEHREG